MVAPRQLLLLLNNTQQRTHTTHKAKRGEGEPKSNGMGMVVYDKGPGALKNKLTGLGVVGWFLGSQKNKIENKSVLDFLSVFL
jgi:hypothetical protein